MSIPHRIADLHSSTGSGFQKPYHALLCLVLLSIGFAISFELRAQNQASDPAEKSEMTVEELEAFLEQQKRELDTVIDNRESALQQQAEIRQRLKEQKVREAELEKQLIELCNEHNETNPDSSLDCQKELNPT